MKNRVVKLLTSTVLTLGLLVASFSNTVEAAGNEYLDPDKCPHSQMSYEGPGVRYVSANSEYHNKMDLEIWHCMGCNSDIELVVNTTYEPHDLMIYASGSYTAKCRDCSYKE